MSKTIQRRRESITELRVSSIDDRIFTEDVVRKIIDAVGVKLPEIEYRTELSVVRVFGTSGLMT